jgi:hypothetical protein
MKSKKTVVIERIFDTLYDRDNGKFTRTVVTAEDVEQAKNYCNEVHGTNLKLNANPFNFMKDIVRGKSAEKIWPQQLRDLQIGGKQKTGDGAIFEFVFAADGGIESLSEDFLPTELTPEFPIQSLSLPIASKALGRTDESWMLQVAVNLRAVETHFATGKGKQIDALEVSHLQMDIKLRKVQIDALYRVLFQREDGSQAEALITVEAKQQRQRILTEQIQRQVAATFESTDAEMVIPMAMAAVAGKGIFVVEFKSVTRTDFDQEAKLIFHRDSMLVLQPPVRGV